VSDQRTRLFVALELPEAVRMSLVAWRTPILEGHAGLRAVAPEAIHVTLCFLGWQLEQEISQIGDRCGEAGALPATELALGSGMWLPSRRPRALAVEIEDPRGALVHVQAALSGALSAGGWYEPESRPYLPHTTVARAGRGVRVTPGAMPAPPHLGFRGSVVTLFRSRLSPSGARYERLRVVAFGP
jgi:RNA 2',3'-cyclic 3'-phosphodiesterase